MLTEPGYFSLQQVLPPNPTPRTAGPDVFPSEGAQPACLCFKGRGWAPSLGLAGPDQAKAPGLATGLLVPLQELGRKGPSPPSPSLSPTSQISTQGSGLSLRTMDV